MGVYDKFTTQQLQDAIDLFAECGSNVSEMARRLGKPRTTVQNMVERARVEGLTPRVIPSPTVPAAVAETISTLRSEVDRLKAELAAATKPRFTVRQDSAPRTEKIRVVCVGDAHDTPGIPDKSRFEWIGKYTKAVKPDVLVQIGDFADLDSLNTHVPNETYAGRAKPTFLADMASFNEALQAINCDGVEKHCTLGNHERRLYLFEDRAPEAYGMMQFELQRIFERNDWTFSPYGEITFYGGVGFVHAALNRLSKTYGGKNAEQTIANDCLHDLVIGHSHTDRKHRAAKIGHNNEVQIINTGCALPQGYMFPYAQHATTGWSYGICDFTIQHGHVQSQHFVTMAELEERYDVAP
jgi:transposase-like protein